MKFIVFEGLDGAGKTSVIKEILKTNKQFIYSKGIGSNTFIGRLARRFPSTFMFSLELIYISLKIRIVYFSKQVIVLQDRYDFSIKSYIPDSDWQYNKIFIRISDLFLIKPYLLVYLEVSLKQRVKRLENEGENKYHKILVNNPQIIIEREKKYLELYDYFNSRKIKIDTTNKTAEEVAGKLKHVIDI